MNPLVTDALYGAAILFLVVGLIAPRFVMPRRFATRLGAALVYGTILAGLSLQAEFGRTGLGIALALLVVAWYILRSHEAAQRRRDYPVSEQLAARVLPPSMPAVPAKVDPARAETPADYGSVMPSLPSWGHRWIPPGQSIKVAGFDLRDGMVYAGSDLTAIRPWGGPEPALINPRLSVGGGSEASEPIGYWPSYAEISPAARERYLRWLATGRQDLSVDIGLVFLFFYGLERRLLHDRVIFEDTPERTAILLELRRLLHLYQDNASFRRYAGSLLSIGPTEVWAPEAANTHEPPAELLRDNQPPSLQLQLRLGELVAGGQPINAGWALAWCYGSPDVGLRTPARRCPEEFGKLFRILYARAFGDGMVIKPNKTPVKFEYRPASASFPGAATLTPKQSLPDVMILKTPTRKLQDLAEQCMTSLEPYSRWLGRNPDTPDDLAGLALLPPELFEARGHAPIDRLASWLDEKLGGAEIVTVPAAELIARCSTADAESLGKAGSAAACTLLGKLSYGLEPDVRFSGPSLMRDAPAILFRSPPGAPSAPSSTFQGATVLLHLAALVVLADGSIDIAEEQRLEEHLEEVLQLSDGERARLRARLRWLLESRPSMAGLRKRLEGLSADHRRSLAEFLIGVAGADGRVSPEEIDLLRRIYPRLGLDPDDLYGHIHALAATAGESLPPAGPVTVRPGGPGTPGHAIPPRPATAASSPGMPAVQGSKGRQAVLLDEEKIRSRLAETAVVASLLASVFVEDEMPAPEPVAVSKPNTAVACIGSLDAAQSAMLRALGEKTEWSRGDFEALAERSGTLPDGSLEAINDACIDLLGEVLTDGDDPIEVNLDVWKELIG